MVLKSKPVYPPPWGPVHIPPEGVRLPLPEDRTLFLAKEGNRLQHRVLNPEEAGGDEPCDVTILHAEGNMIYRPLMPERSIVLRSAHELRILPRGSFHIMVQVPLVPSLAIQADDSEILTVLEVAVCSLSNTWFGDPVSGEPAYALNTALTGGDNIENPGPWEALCHLTVTNGSHEPLQFKRLILRVPYLTLYAGAGRIYSNELTVRFRGQDQASQIQIAPGAPQVGEPVSKICEPRRNKDKDLIKRSFSFFRSLYSL
jgi:hypothetical protein